MTRSNFDNKLMVQRKSIFHSEHNHRLLKSEKDDIRIFRYFCTIRKFYESITFLLLLN